MLEISQLSAGYGQVEVLWEVDLEVGDGEIVALVGSNGAGKTTLLRAVSGMIATTSGQVSFDGESLTGLRPEQVVGRGIAHVPEGRHLFSGLTVKENLMAGAFARRNGSDVERALELIRSLKDDGVTVLVVEHVMKAIMAVSDSLLVMHEGKELVYGDPKEVMEDERVIEAYLGQRYAQRAKEDRDA